MPWAPRNHPDRRIIEVHLVGRVTADDINQVTFRIVDDWRASGINRFLVDAADAVSAPPLADILRLPAEEYDKLGLDRQSRIAVIAPRNQEARVSAQFYETACVNRGWNVKLHLERREAEGWLLVGVD
jgi:hypothetical protein